MRDNTERSPLLRRDSDRAPKHVPADVPPEESNSYHSLFVFFLCALLIFMVELGGIMQITPLNQVAEEIICRKFVNRESTRQVAQDRCKDADVQAELSNIQAWRGTAETIPGLIMAVPYGMAADKYGYSLILGLSLTGMSLSYAANVVICAFPAIFHIRLLWLSPIFNLVGGGGTVFTAILFSIVNSVSTEAQRSTAFFYIWGVIFVGQIVSNSLTFYVMEINIWLAIYIGLLIQVAATLVAYVIPTTIVRATKDSTIFNHSDSRESPHVKTPPETWINMFRVLARKVTSLLRWVLFENYSLGLLLLTLLFTSLGQYAKVLELQYITMRYSLSWSKAGLILISRTITSMLLFLLGLPLVGNLLLTKFKLLPTAKDLLLARLSLVFMTIGAVVIGLAGDLVLLVVGTVLLSVGGGYSLLTRSLLTSLIDKQHAGTLYTAIGVIENIGQLVAGPLVSSIFGVGLVWGDQWVGLPYLVVGASYLFSFVIISFVNLKSTEIPADCSFNEDVES